MLILALDSAGAGCGAVVWRDGKVLAERREAMERGQDRRLMPLILEVMKEAKTEFDALDRIAVTRGPGSFTGLRIGLAAARGIGLASGKPVIGIDRFSIFRAQTEASPLLVVINSKRKELYCRFYPAQGNAEAPVMMTADEIAAFLASTPNTIVTGDFCFAPPPLTQPSASTLRVKPSRGGEHDRSRDKEYSSPLEGEVRREGVRLGGKVQYVKPVESEAVTAAALAARADANDPAFLPRPLYLRAPDVTVRTAV